MINRKLTGAVAVLATMTWLSGCKPEESAPPAAEPRPPAASTNRSLDQAKVAVDDAVAAAKLAGSNVVEDVKRTGAAVVATGAAKAQEMGNQAGVEGQKLIDAAQRYCAEGKWTNALQQLQQASGTNLSEQQQQTVAALKKQIEAALAATSQITTNATQSATDAINRLFK